LNVSKEKQIYYVLCVSHNVASLQNVDTTLIVYNELITYQYEQGTAKNINAAAYIPK
jgi:hypothetical protein